LQFTQRGILAYTLGTAARLQGKYGEPAEAVPRGMKSSSSPLAVLSLLANRHVVITHPEIPATCK